MSEQTVSRRYLTVAETAKLVRKALADAHPGVRFAVRSKSYSGGASVHVRWTDGPTEDQVRRTSQMYAGASFDGMIDLQSYHDSVLSTPDGAELVHFGADYVLDHRDISDEFRADLEAEIAEYAGEPFNGSKRYPITSWYDRETGMTRLANDAHCGEYGSSLVYQLAHGRVR